MVHYSVANRLRNSVTNRGGAMMVTTFLSDEVINSKELRDNQKYWFEKAYVNPVSVRSGNKKLVLLNREHARDIYTLNHYAKMIIQFCQEQGSGTTKESDVFPWIRHLSERAILEFHKELLSTFDDVIHSKDWDSLEEMIDAWIATSEAMTNPEMVELINADLNKEEFTKVG